MRVAAIAALAAAGRAGICSPMVVSIGCGAQVRMDLITERVAERMALAHDCRHRAAGEKGQPRGEHQNEQAAKDAVHGGNCNMRQVSSPAAPTPEIAQNLARAVVPRRSGDPAPGMSAGAAQVQALERRAVVGVTEQWARRPQLLPRPFQL